MTISTSSPMLPNPAPAGLWKVLCIIAKRVPPKHLIWLALIVCLSTLGLAIIMCVGIGRVATSKPATTLTGFVELHPIPKAANAP